MALIPVTADTPTTFVDTATHAMTVTVDLTGINFSVYLKVFRGGVEILEGKIVHGTPRSFDIIKNDTVTAIATGTGTISVTTA